MGSAADIALGEVEPPRRLSRWVDKFTDEQIKAIINQLRNGKWLSDSKESCDGRSQAYYRAEALIERVVTLSDIERYQLQRRTWPENGGHRWAIRLRRE